MDAFVIGKMRRSAGQAHAANESGESGYDDSLDFNHCRKPWRPFGPREWFITQKALMTQSMLQIVCPHCEATFNLKNSLQAGNGTISGFCPKCRKSCKIRVHKGMPTSVSR